MREGSAVMETLLDKYVINGGPMMAPLILCSLLMIGAALQGLIRLRRSRVLPGSVLHEARRLGGPAARRPFVMGLRAHTSPLARAVWFALKDFIGRDRSPELSEVDSLVEDASRQAADEMYDGLGLLSTIYTIAPLLGLMGTILGMMKAFYEFGVRREKSIEILSVGIQEALVTTLWGLGIAVIAYLAAQWLHARIRQYERMELPIATREVVVTLYEAHGEADEQRSAEAADSPRSTIRIEGQA